MTIDEIQASLSSKFPSISFYKKAIGLVAVVEVADFALVADFCRHDEMLLFDHLHNFAAVDYPPDRIEIFAQIYSLPHRHKLTIKTILDRTDPRCPTLCGVYPAANWYERETYDLFGVIFTGHPDLRRLFLPDYWVGHPLRKDYKDSRIIPLPEVTCE